MVTDGSRQTEWERSSKPLANPKMATVKPEDRYKKIIKLAGDRNFGTDLYLKELNIHVDTTNMMQVQDVQNLSQKINGKLGGINGFVNVKLALNHPSDEDLFMFFGAD
ncbi:unnamed protein product, partial [Rotaria sp. Silwood2]